MKKTYFVSRHKGAQEWALRRGIKAQVIEHFDPSIVEQDDVVIGTLPIHLAKQVCEKGGLYVHLMMDVPAVLRGREISADMMEELGADLAAFEIIEIPIFN